MLHSMKPHIWLLGVALLLMTACTQELPNPPHFPQQYQGFNIILDADLAGELVSENGCLRVRGVEIERNYLLIWPEMFEMTEDGLGVRPNKNSEVSLSVGDWIQMGGGVPPYDIHEIVLQPIPNDCPGPYWLVGREISVSSE